MAWPEHVHRHGGQIVHEMLNNWGRLEEWWTPGATGDLQGLAVLLLTKLMLVDSKVTTLMSTLIAKYSFDVVFAGQ